MFPENNFTINVVEPSPNVPETGLFSTGANNTGSIITIVTSVAILSILAFILFRFFKKHKNVIRTHNFKRQFKNLFAKRSFVMTMSLLTLVAFGATFTMLKNNLGSGAEAISIENIEDYCDAIAVECEKQLLSITTEDIYMEVELDNRAVYAETANTITVNSDTSAGYVLYATIDSDDSDLYLNGADKDNEGAAKITAMSTEAKTLAGNTWGVSLSDPVDQNSNTFRKMPNFGTDKTTMLLRAAGAATKAGDSTTVYYGAYLTPGLPYGEYSTKIVYIALANPYVNEGFKVNYHSSEGGTFSNGTDVNTVNYAFGCGTAYLGSNCRSAYKDAQAAETVTLEDIKNNGIMVRKGGDGEDADAKTYIYTVTVPDAEKIQLSAEYNLSSHVLFTVIRGGIDTDAGYLQENFFDMARFGYAVINATDIMSGNTDGIPRVATYNTDTISLIVNEESVGAIEDEGNKLKAEIFTVYDEAPQGKNVVATSICDTLKTDNIDEYGTWFGPYVGGIDVDSITVPGADAIAIDFSYALTGDPSSWLNSVIFVGAGQIRSIGMFGDADANYIGAQAFELDIKRDMSGQGTVVFEGDTVSMFYLIDSQERQEGYNYGFFAKIRPVYDTPQQGSESVSDCSVRVVKGSYEEPSIWKGLWVDEDGNDVTEPALRMQLEANYSDAVGQTLDLYALNPYTIAYDGNNATTGDMDDYLSAVSVDSTLGDYTIDLIAPNFKKDGYGFAGWSLKPNARVNDPAFDGIIYGPNQTITQDDIRNTNFIDDYGKTATLYAVWVQADENQTMQTFTCDTLQQGDIIALRDERDDNVYTVAKLSDGNCWMMEDLKLGSDAIISASNTDNPADTFTGLSDTSFIWCSDNNDACINQSKFNDQNSRDDGTRDDSGLAYIDGPGKLNDITGRGIGGGSLNFGYQWYSYGNYYNWYSATASNGNRATGTEEDIDGNIVSKEEDVAGSICPTGWNLPIGGDAKDANDDTRDKSFAKLNENMNDAKDWRAFPNNFTYAGKWDTIYNIDRGTTGYYLSRTAVSESDTAVLTIQQNSVNISDTLQKYGGATVRCVHE